MNAAIFLGWIVLLLALAAAFWRLLAGPTRADRLVALDLLFVLAVVAALLAALATGLGAFIDVALGLGLTGFVTTLAWSRPGGGRKP